MGGDLPPFQEAPGGDNPLEGSQLEGDGIAEGGDTDGDSLNDEKSFARLRQRMENMVPSEPVEGYDVENYQLYLVGLVLFKEKYKEVLAPEDLERIFFLKFLANYAETAQDEAFLNASRACKEGVGLVFGQQEHDLILLDVEEFTLFMTNHLKVSDVRLKVLSTEDTFSSESLISIEFTNTFARELLASIHILRYNLSTIKREYRKQIVEESIGLIAESNSSLRGVVQRLMFGKNLATLNFGGIDDDLDEHEVTSRIKDLEHISRSELFQDCKVDSKTLQNILDSIINSLLTYKEIRAELDEALKGKK